MGRTLTGSLAILGCFVLAATASSQSLVELAEKEKACRAEISKTGKTVEVVDAHALSRIDPSIVTAIEVTGSSQSVEASAPELGRPPLENPHRATPYTPPTTTRARRGELGRGWSPGSEHTPGERGWSGGGEYPTDGRGWSRGRESAPGGRGWSDRPAVDRGYSTGGDYDTAGRGWTQGGENPARGRGWSQK